MNASESFLSKTSLTLLPLNSRSRKAAEQNEAFKATYGNLTVDDNGVSISGNTTGQAFKTVEFKYGDTKIGSGAISFQGHGNPDVVHSILNVTSARTTAAQQSPPTSSSSANSHGQGRQASTEDTFNRSSNNSTTAAVPLAIRSASDYRDENLWALLPEMNATRVT